MKLDRDKLKKRNGYLEGKADALDKTSIAKALAYKADFLKKFIAISPPADRRAARGFYLLGHAQV